MFILIIIAAILCCMSFFVETFFEFVIINLVVVALGYMSTKPWETKVTYHLVYRTSDKKILLFTTSSYIYTLIIKALYAKDELVKEYTDEYEVR